MEKEESELKSSVISLEVSDLDGENTINIPSVFSVKKMSVPKDDIARQSDVDCWPYLQAITIPEIDDKVGLLLGNDVPKALQPAEIRDSDQDVPYAVRTLLSWTINGPLGQNVAHETTANFIHADKELDKECAIGKLCQS